MTQKPPDAGGAEMAGERPHSNIHSALQEPLIREEDLQLLATSIRDVTGKRRELQATYWRIARKALSYVTALASLYELLPGVYNRDPAATSEFLAFVDSYHNHAEAGREMLQAAEENRGRFRSLALRADPGVRLQDAGGAGCFMVDPGKFGALAVGVAVASGGLHSSIARDRIATLAGLSGCLGGIETLFDAALREDMEGLDRRMRWLGNEWLGESLPPEAADDVIFGERADPVGESEFVDPAIEESFITPRRPDGFPIGGPDEGPPRCPPPIEGPCEEWRRHCQREVLDAAAKGSLAQPTIPYMSTDGITGLSTHEACAGDTVTILGSGFGDRKPEHIDVVLKVGEECQVVEASSWTDTAIEVELPSDTGVSCVGFVDHDALERAREQAEDRSLEIGKLNSHLTCLRRKPIPTPLPPPEIECPPCSDVNRLVVGKPIIHFFEANGETRAVVAPDDDIRLQWSVENADQIVVSRVSAKGPGFNGNSKALNPPGTSWSLGAPAHTSPEVFAYQLTVRNGCGEDTATVQVIASARPRLSIDQVEVTQGIQTPDNDVPLVRDKRTIVRVYVSHGLDGFGDNEVPDVKGRLRVRRKGGSWSRWLDPVNDTTPPEPNPDAMITVPATVDREETNHTLNFLLAAARCRGTLEVEAEVRVDSFGAFDHSPGFSQQVSAVFKDFTFHRRRRLRIRYIPVRWDNKVPTKDDIEQTLRRSLDRIPTPEGSIIEVLPGQDLKDPVDPEPRTLANICRSFFNMTHPPRELCDLHQEVFETIQRQALIDLLEEFNDRRDPKGLFGKPDPAIEEKREIWALMTGGYDRGRAAERPGYTLLTPVGLNTKAAHELSHCLNQPHINICGASHGDQAIWWPKLGQLENVPFNIEENRTVSDKDGVWDLMTYCHTRWPMPRRWQELYDFIGG